MDSAAFKNFQKWAQRPDTKAKEATSQTAQVNIDEQRKTMAETAEGPGSLQSVFGSDRHYWSQKMNSALGLT